MSDFVFPVPVPTPQQFNLHSPTNTNSVYLTCNTCQVFFRPKTLDEAVAMADQHEQERHADLPAVSA